MWHLNFTMSNRPILCVWKQAKIKFQGSFTFPCGNEMELQRDVRFCHVAWKQEWKQRESWICLCVIDIKMLQAKNKLHGETYLLQISREIKSGYRAIFDGWSTRVCSGVICHRAKQCTRGISQMANARAVKCPDNGSQSYQPIKRVSEQ